MNVWNLLDVICFGFIHIYIFIVYMYIYIFSFTVALSRFIFSWQSRVLVLVPMKKECLISWGWHWGVPLDSLEYCSNSNAY